MRLARPRRYKLERNAARYRDKLAKQYPERKFAVRPLADFKWGVAIIRDDGTVVAYCA